MLPIPLKSSTGVNLVNPLRVYVSNEYSEAQAKEVEPDLKALERLRTMSLQARAATEASIGTIQAYYNQVNRLQAIFPIHPDHIRVAFTWHDAFRPTKKFSEIDLNFEKAGLLFNIGAVKSHIAASADRTSPDGVKLACREFQLAAGVFKHLREHVVSQMTCSLSSELTTEGLLMVENIMLAQAQACFYEKAVGDRVTNKAMKISVIALLASQAAEMYNTALKNAESPAMDAAGLDRSWPVTLRFQHEFYTAAAQYYQSEAVKEAALGKGAGYGEEITRLRLAQRLIEGVLDTANKQRMGPAIVGKAELLKAKIVKNRAVAEKDNSTIYLEPIPAEAALKPIGKACMVKVLDPDFPPPSQQQQLFATLLPKPVKEALTAFQKTTTTLTTTAEQAGRDASKDARQQLAKVGLPGSLQAHESPAGLPEATWKKLQNLREKQSTVSDLQGELEELHKAAGGVAGIFLKIETILKEEEGKDEGFRGKYGEAWEQYGVGDSTQLMQETWKEVKHFQTLFASAQKSDEYLATKLRSPEMENLAALLGASRRELDTRLAKPEGGAAVAPVVVDTKALSEAMMQLAKLLDERDVLLTKMKAEPDALSEVLKGKLLGGEEVEKATAEALFPLEGLKKELDLSIERQAPVLEQILRENQKFHDGRKADPALLERDKLIQQLENGVLACHELHAQLSEGKEFYASVSKRIQQLLLVVEDQVYTQDIQRRDFEIEVGQTAQRRQQETADQELARKLFDQLNVASGGAAAPGAPGATAPPTGPPPAYQQQYGGGGATLPSPQAPPPPSPPPAPLPSFGGSAAGPPPSYEQAQALPIGQPAYDEKAKVTTLVQMGFPEAAAKAALAQYKGDLQSALNSLLSG